MGQGSTVLALGAYGAVWSFILKEPFNPKQKKNKLEELASIKLECIIKNGEVYLFASNTDEEVLI